jgi:hypothetical protein
VFQMEMQKKLHEQLEVLRAQLEQTEAACTHLPAPACALQQQRQLQLSLEAHGRYIASLIEKEGITNPMSIQPSLNGPLAALPGVATPLQVILPPCMSVGSVRHTATGPPPCPDPAGCAPGCHHPLTATSDSHHGQ